MRTVLSGLLVVILLVSLPLLAAGNADLGFILKTSWGYFGYHEKGPVDSTGSRDFRANLVNMALRYVF